MIKSNITKLILLFVIIAVMFTATTMTAYAESDEVMDYDFEISLHDYGEELFDEPTTDDDPETGEPPLGSLIIINSTHDGQLLEGAVFSLYRVGEDTLIADMVTLNDGRTDEISLAQGNYNIVVATPANGHLPVSNMVIATITAGQIQELTMYSVPKEPPTPTPEPPEPTSTPVPIQPSQATAPIQSSPATAQNTNQSESATQDGQMQVNSSVEITTRAEQSGNPLKGTTFTIYRVSDNQRVGEIITDTNGKATKSLAQGEYYLRNESVQYGFLREQTRIFFTVRESGDIAVEVTIQRDASIPYADTGNITLPQTGELPPVMNYVMGMLFLTVALICGIGFLKQRNPQKTKGDPSLCLTLLSQKNPQFLRQSPMYWEQRPAVTEVTRATVMSYLGASVIC